MCEKGRLVGMYVYVCEVGTGMVTDGAKNGSSRCKLVDQWPLILLNRAEKSFDAGPESREE